MSEAQRRRELADRLGLYICDEQLCESYADAMMDAAEILRSDAAALEAVGVEPIGYFYELESANEKAGPIWQGCESEAVCDVVAADIERKSFPLYGPDVALRLTEALRQRDVLAKVLKAVLQTGRGTSGRIILERLQEADIRAVLREVGHE